MWQGTEDGGQQSYGKTFIQSKLSPQMSAIPAKLISQKHPTNQLPNSLASTTYNKYLFL